MTTSVELAVRTDPGRDPDKQVNEDAAAHAETPLGLLAVVCDGMGGHAGGKEASELAVATILEIVKAATPKTHPGEALRVAIEEANRRVWSMPTMEAGYRPGSTVVAVLVHEGGAEVAHVGDSRVYLVHAGAISQVTRDHSMVQEMVDRNLLRAEDAASHPDANKILRALGIAKDVDVEVRPTPIPYVAGDTLVLCSDGLSDLVSAAEILDVAGSSPPAQAAGQLVDLANARGGHDNITAMVARFRASAAVREGATLVKTVQLTAHDAAPLEPGGGPHGTVLAAPAKDPQAAGTAPLVPPAAAPAAAPSSPSAISSASGSHAAIPPGPPRPTMPPRSRAPIFVGLALALVVLGGLVTVFWKQSRPRHKTPVLVGELPDAAPAAPVVIDEDADDGPEPEVTTAPPLAPPPSADAGAHATAPPPPTALPKPPAPRPTGTPPAPRATAKPPAPSPTSPPSLPPR